MEETKKRESGFTIREWLIMSAVIVVIGLIVIMKLHAPERGIVLSFLGVLLGVLVFGHGLGISASHDNESHVVGSFVLMLGIIIFFVCLMVSFGIAMHAELDEDFKQQASQPQGTFHYEYHASFSR